MNLLKPWGGGETTGGPFRIAHHNFPEGGGEKGKEESPSTLSIPSQSQGEGKRNLSRRWLRTSTVTVCIFNVLIPEKEKKDDTFSNWEEGRRNTFHPDSYYCWSNGKKGEKKKACV